ncbi:MAG: 8-oxo-dGTP diphosphatase [Myxococcota bacterium]|nr:8-oxo-dGTP diphosphatase [Myxococcota bacterium]
MTSQKVPMRVEEVCWETWEAIDVATLLFVMREDKMLLIQKKRGLGKGKINAPGGKLEPGETPKEAALREIREEVGISVERAQYAGEHFFQFTNGYKMHVYVYTADQFTGTPVETEEAIPFWCDIHDIPYDQMWADDRYWLPLMLSGERFVGYYIFDEDHLISYRILTDSNP